MDKFKKHYNLKEYVKWGEANSAPLETLNEERNKLHEIIKSYNSNNVFNTSWKRENRPKFDQAEFRSNGDQIEVYFFGVIRMPLGQNSGKLFDHHSTKISNVFQLYLDLLNFIV